MAKTRMAYDANGNITQMPNTGTMVYDGRNRMVYLNVVPVAYDPDNRRVFHVEGGPVVDFLLPNGEKLMTLGIEDAVNQAADATPTRSTYGGRIGRKGRR